MCFDAGGRDQLEIGGTTICGVIWRMHYSTGPNWYEVSSFVLSGVQAASECGYYCQGNMRPRALSAGATDSKYHKGKVMVMPDLRGGSKPLSSGDALFLYLERPAAPLNVAAMCTVDGVVPLDLCTEFIESKLPLIPRYRQRVVAPPFDLGLPTWEYDPNFDIHNHVREVRLKRGTDAEFKAIAARLLSSTLDRSRPLWDITFLQGLKGNRTGMIIRLHHCLADGVSGVGIMKALLDPSPEPPRFTKEQEQFQPPPLRNPSLIEALIKSCSTMIERAFTVQSQLLDMANHAVGSMLQPESESRTAGDFSDALMSPAADLSQLVPEFGSPTYRLPFNKVCRGPQRYNWAHLPLDEMKAVKNVCEATINDVVLTVVTDAIRRYSELHGAELSGKAVRIIVPVNLRPDGEVSDLGNRITFLPVNIPLDIDDPRELLAAVRVAVARARKAHMAEVIGLVGTLVESIPTPLQAMLLPLAGQLPLSVCNTIITNVPGPNVPLYLLGHRMLSCYPYVPIGGEMGMNCAVLTYDGTAFFGFGGDAYAIPDLRRMEKLLTTSFAELKKAVGLRAARRARPRPKPQQVKTKARPRAKQTVPESAADALSGTAEPDLKVEEKAKSAGVAAPAA